MKINVKVFPKSGEEKVVAEEGSNYLVFLKKEAKNNKANEELKKVLEKHFGSKVKILKGKSSRKKVVEVEELGD